MYLCLFLQEANTEVWKDGQFKAEDSSCPLGQHVPATANLPPEVPKVDVVCRIPARCLVHMLSTGYSLLSI